MQPKIVLSAIQPSNSLTLGNYLGALKNWIRFQQEHECYFCVVDLHSLSGKRDGNLYQNSLESVAFYLACGISSEKSTLFIQSHVHEHTELAWILTCFTPMGELSRMTQFKEKSQKQQKDSANVGLFTYPILMAADILLYQADLVPVGEDQKQHLEFTRDLAVRMNQKLKAPLFKLPTGFIPKTGARIMSLQNPHSKMSKSDPNPQGTIFLTDSNDTIISKFKKAVTDSQSTIRYTPDQPGIKNLLDILATLLNKEPLEVEQSYQGKTYAQLKLDTAEQVIKTLEPIQKKLQQSLEDHSSLIKILDQGRIKAQQKAQQTLRSVQDKLQMIPKFL